MTGVAKVLRYTAFTMMALFGLVGGLFVAGSAFEEPGGWAAVGLTALWVLPLVGLSLLALFRAETAGPVFVAVSAAVGLFTLADAAFGIVPRDAWGPVAAIAVFTLGVALAFLGLHRARLAGLLLLLVALAQLVATVVGIGVHEAEGPGPGVGAVLGGSSGIMVVPLLIVGLLFLVAGSLDHEPLRPSRPPQMRTAH